MHVSTEDQTYEDFSYGILDGRLKEIQETATERVEKIIKRLKSKSN